ncbi:MAG: hypothetical protein NC548_50650 [Lachnospiraceae bacterium]|nr:hypothetical protein [Lachnospiraceae bacterium]
MNENEMIHRIDSEPLDAGAASKDINLGSLVEDIRESLMSIKQNYLKIGWILKYIKETKLYKQEGLDNIYEFARRYFDLSQPAVSRFINICEKFAVGDRPELMPQYRSYNLSQLIELLPMEDDLRNQVRPEMTVLEIRKLKGTGAKKEKKETTGEDAHTDGQKADVPYVPSNCDYILPEVMGDGWDRVLPVFQNDSEIRAWLEDVEAWGIWYIDPNVWAEYFKYDFEDGSRLIAVKYKDLSSSYYMDVRSDDIHYHMVFSSDYLEKHQDGLLSGYKNHSIFDATPVEAMVRFLKEIQSVEPEIRIVEDDGVGADGKHDGLNGYISNEYVMEELDLDQGRRTESFVGRKYSEFYDKHGYIPENFNAKHCTEVRNNAQTLTTGSGSVSGMGSIVRFDAVREAAAVINDKGIDIKTACKKIDKILRVADPEEKNKVEKLLDRAN